MENQGKSDQNVILVAHYMGARIAEDWWRRPTCDFEGEVYQKELDPHCSRFLVVTTSLV